jgi:hypothetical protein
MITILFLALLAGQDHSTADSVDTAAAYRAVLEHIRSTSSAAPTTALVLDDSRFFNDPAERPADPVARSLPPALMTRLEREGLVSGHCRAKECTTTGDRTVVRLGVVLGLPEGTRVNPEPGDRVAGESRDGKRAAEDDAAVPADAAVDVVVTTPCPAPPGSERCRFPDTVIWRYFLREESAGGYRVVTRWLSGAV